MTKQRIHAPAPPPQEKREEIIEQLRAEYGGIRTGRHEPTFKCGLRLAQAGFSQEEIEEELFQLLGDDRNSRRHVASTINSLKKYGRLK